MPPRLCGFIAYLLLSCVFSASSAAQDLRARLIVAEDRRAQTESELSALKQALTHNDPKLRQQAVRAIGRLERPDLIVTLTRSLTDNDVNVRMEAVNAVGQSAKGAKGVADAKGRLVARARVERDPRVWGVVAATLGRLAYTSAADIDQVEAIIARVLPNATSTSIRIDELGGAVEGLEALARQSGKISKLKGTTLNGLRAAASLEGRAEEADKLARIRRLATLALTAAGGVTRPRLEGGIADPDDEVRRLTMVAAREADIEGREAVVSKGLVDANPRVRFEALRTWGRILQKTSCDPAIAALGDSSPHVALLAIDLLGEGCVGRDPIPQLRDMANGSLDQPRAWHRPAHAIVSLAKVSATDATALLPRFATHRVWQVRVYAAQAAGALKDTATLAALVRDGHHNVREAALSELVALKRPEASAAALEAMASTDYQLVITAARALARAPDPASAIPILQKSFARIRAERRDTARDALNAIRDAMAKLGGPALPEPEAQPIETPTFRDSELDGLRTMRLRFTMAGLGSFDVRLLPDEAAVTSLHIASLARQGYYQGLTFHRVAPNFVIQGGGPGANEYSGQGPFMRDEVGLRSHRRGTVGISTRGRDTGDAQFFVNLVDSPRLDHTYTVFAEVVSGLDIVDAILEGDVIERVELIPPQS